MIFLPKARFYKTLFLPPLEGQYQVWKQEFAPLAGKVDEIVHLGNLIGCYPRVKDQARLGPNLATLNFTLLWRATFPNWTQLIGPNEVMALNFPDEWTNEESNRVLRRRWLLEEEGSFVVASVNKQRLVSHGGLTHGEWLTLGKPPTAAEAAEALQEKYRKTLYQGPSFRTTGRPSSYANPIFADPLRETYTSWILADEDPPFGQVHAGPALNSMAGRAALTSPYSPLQALPAVTYTNFGSIVTLGSSLFYGVGMDMPRDRLIKSLPEPWVSYIEKIPVVDMRDELFNAPLED